MANFKQAVNLGILGTLALQSFLALTTPLTATAEISQGQHVELASKQYKLSSTQSQGCYLE